MIVDVWVTGPRPFQWVWFDAQAHMIIEVEYSTVTGREVLLWFACKKQLLDPHVDRYRIAFDPPPDPDQDVPVPAVRCERCWEHRESFRSQLVQASIP